MVIDSQRLVSKWVRVNISNSQKMMASFRTDQEKPYMGSIGTQSSVAIYTQEISPEMYLYIYTRIYTHVYIYMDLRQLILQVILWPNRIQIRQIQLAEMHKCIGECEAWLLWMFFFPWFCVLWRLNGGLMVFNGVLGCLMMFNSGLMVV